jgi:hypothetical protein
MTRRIALPALLIIALLALAVSLQRSTLKASATPAPVQDRARVVKFSHKKHIGEIGAECAACHESAQTSRKSTDNLLPAKAACATCHDVQDTTQCSLCHFEKTTPVKFGSPQRDVLFSHEAHLAGRGLDCASCHAGIENAEDPEATHIPAMATCTGCHDNRKASNTCEQCHTDFAMMLPSDHRESNFVTLHRDDMRLGTLTVECATCHTETFCQECHQNAGLKAFTPKDLTTDGGPKRSTQDSPDRTILQNVHGLNYRFTHGIDARAKQSNCASCHTTETFCAECHAAGGNITQTSFKPASHLVAGFAVLTPGAGGGLHAEEAERDLESCMSCHNVEGKDPVCMMCHQSGTAR